ncbi:putative pre-mrna-splicing factor cwc21 [Phaeomoniella chlamydospora]|uniref:Putative pre-mrna-splicing factor cwc21 n=1 Tax=Phaeomoniella chlamydospora TaxID=158046 RepID=A0A0G2GQ34_PHACM|nr:putative pre-mrna-splicing factor cwc21 [Phaeomoniella chlamydospora]
MSSNVGLTTPRGSGTSGYVQRNLSVLKTRDYGTPYPDPKKDLRQHRQPDKQILDHDRKREIEVKVFNLRDELEEEGKLDEDEIEEKCDGLRTQLLEEFEQGKTTSGKGAKGLKKYQVHELAEAKEKELDKFRRAVGVKEGAEERLWDRENVKLESKKEAS